MTTTVVLGPADEFPVVAGQLLEIAKGLGLPPSVVKITHDPMQVFVVPDEVAAQYSADREASAPPKRRRRAAASEESVPVTGEEEGSADA